jgi:hypothetical protein
LYHNNKNNNNSKNHIDDSITDDESINIEDPDDIPDLSESHLFFCSGNKCNVGSKYEDILEYAKNYGVTTEEYFPYEEKTFDKCCPKEGWTTTLTFIKDYQEISSSDIQYAIYTNGPVLTGIKVYEDLFYYKSGVYRHAFGRFVGYHAILIVGYGVEEESGLLGKLGLTTKYYIVKNSWSTNWGDNGFFKIKEGECGMDKLGFYSVEI